MKPPLLDVVVVGAGHAGLAISYCLVKHGLNHLVFEQGKIGETWRTQRWDLFRLNSSNKFNPLPGHPQFFDDPEVFSGAADFVSYLEFYVRTFKLPVVEHARVLSIEKETTNNNFKIMVLENKVEKQYHSKQVVIASGCQNQALVPPFAKEINSSIFQLHTSQYRNAAQMPPGAVLVVGSAQSGTQVADDLVEAGKTVFLSTGKVGRIPRRYRGKDIFEWLFDLGFFEQKREAITDPQILKMRPPQVSGVGLRGRTSSLQSLSRKGVVILGKTIGADRNSFFLQPNASEHVQFADAFSGQVKAQIDSYIAAQKIEAAPVEEDIDDMPDTHSSCASAITELDLNANDIASVIWATGFVVDYRYVNLPVFHEDGTPNHSNGVSDVAGLYFLGLPWLRTRKSGIIWGAADDAAFIAEQILQVHTSP